MKLTELLSDSYNAEEWRNKGYELPQFDIRAVRKNTFENPTWVHFGGGNIFRAFPAAILNDALTRENMTAVSLLQRLSTMRSSTKPIRLMAIFRCS